MKIPIHSSKYGVHDLLIDDEDYFKLKDYSFYLWSTPRHSGIYVNCYSPEDRRKPKRLHRIILEAEHKDIVDHINGNPLDNQRSNLRIVTYTTNNQNARKRKGNLTSKFKGVCRRQNKWHAQIQVNYKKISLGLFETEIEAAHAYNLYLKINNIQSPYNNC